MKAAHFTHNYLLNPTNPISVALIGAGGTGSQMLTCLGRMHQAMLALDHPGLRVTVYDDDTVNPANLGRQLFAEAEIGMYKGAALLNRINRFFGTNWKVVTKRFNEETVYHLPEDGKANLFISCVDSAKSRFTIADVLKRFRNVSQYDRHKPFYWMDLGNSRDTGQVILSTIGEHEQPASKKFGGVGNLPFVTDTFRNLLLVADTDDDTPSCSLAEALTKQDLFINSALANTGASLLWSLFREGVLLNRGFFLNLGDFRMLPIKVTADVSPELTKAA